MALCTTTCDGKTMVAYTEPDCENFYRLGNSTSIAYILCKDTNDLLRVDYTLVAPWNTAIAGVDSFKDLNVVNKVLISRPEGENLTIENPTKGGVPNLKVGESHTLTITDPKVTVDNHEFYNSIDGKTAWVVIAYNDGRMEVSPRPMMLMVKSPAIEYGTSQTFKLEAQANFDKDEYWLPFDTQPTGIFTFQ
jgi:predicted secreted protein